MVGEVFQDASNTMDDRRFWFASSSSLRLLLLLDPVHPFPQPVGHACAPWNPCRWSGADGPYRRG